MLGASAHVLPNICIDGGVPAMEMPRDTDDLSVEGCWGLMQLILTSHRPES